MKSTRNRETFCKANELQPLMIVSVSGSRRGSRVVVFVSRANLEIDALRAQIAKTSSRPKLEPLAEQLVEMLRAVSIYGREARVVRFDGDERLSVLGSQDKLRYLGQAPRSSVARVGR